MRHNAAFWPTLALAFVLGLIGVVISSQLIEPYRSVFHEIGAGLIVAALLGGTIDTFLKRAITKDAVEAALGYVLPPELRDELRWIYDQKILCTEHHTRFRVQRIDDRLITLSVRFDRTMKNISGDSCNFDFPLAVDDWGYTDHPSQIHLLGYQIEGENATEYTGPALKVSQRSPHELSAEIPPTVLAKGHSITVWAEYTETCRINDHHILVFRVPTQNPHVEVVLDPGFDVVAQFGHRGKFSTTRLGTHAWQLHGLLLPNQFIRIVWWPNLVQVATEPAAA